MTVTGPGPGTGPVAPSTPSTPQGKTDRRANTLGWIGVALVTLIVSLFAHFAFGEGITDGLPSFLGHFLQLAVVLSIGLLAITRPRIGAVILVLPGLFVVGFGVVRHLFAGRLMETFWTLQIGIPLVAAAFLLYVGRPEPKRRAYWVVVGVPLLIGLLTALVMLLMGPGTA